MAVDHGPAARGGPSGAQPAGQQYAQAVSGMADTDRANGAQPGLDEAYTIGQRVLCQASFDASSRPADIVDVRIESSAPLYYVHYHDCDKRLDEWVAASRVSTLLSAPSLGTELSQYNLLSVSSVASDCMTLGSDQKMTRHKKRRHDDIHHVGQSLEELAPIDQHLEKQHQEKTKVKNINVVEMGKFEMDTWYYSPYPEPYCGCEKLYVCEYTMKYFRKPKSLERHLAKLQTRQPPGLKIYHSPTAAEESVLGSAVTPAVAVFEVDGKSHKVYCQNLCLFSKLFLDHKTLYYDVDPFLFYIFCEVDQEGYHILGYFSKEKNSTEGYNLACILTLPPYQRKGYGRFLISFSYELSKKESKIGTPERPLSDLGHVSYRSYWTRVVLDVLQQHRGNLSIKDISELTAIRTDDIVKTLESLNLIKYWKGDHIISVTPRIIDEHLKTMSSQRGIEIDVSRLKWKPPLTGPPAKKV
jgi:histone acetyltransferase MYST1